jgi:DNA-directed RNA polymerase I, II, and III subunit RPABC2
MSDNSDYYSESGSESEDSDNELEIKTNKLPIQFKPSNNIESYNDESDIEESEEEGENEEEDDIEQKGGVDDFESEPESVDDEEEDDDIELDEDGEPIIKPETVTKAASKNNKIKKTPQLIIDEDEEEEDDEFDENYLQKFDNEITKSYIDSFHPECLMHNYDEIEKMTIVVRNADNIIVDPNHKTIPYLTKYEKARILGQRAKQIETGAKPLVKVPENIVDSYIIAELELKQKNIPFIIKRPIPNGSFEYWKLKDLEMIGF